MLLDLLNWLYVNLSFFSQPDGHSRDFYVWYRGKDS